MATAVLMQLLPHILPHVIDYALKNNKTWNGSGSKGYDYDQDPQVQNAMKLWEQSPYNQQFNPGQANQQFNEQVADPATKYYQERIQPNTRNQFFSPSGVNTTAMQKALTQGAEDLGGSLGSLRSNYLQNQQQNHSKGQYDLIAQQLGLSKSRAQENQLQGQNQGIGSGVNGWLSEFLKSPQFSNLFNKKGSSGGEVAGNYTPWNGNEIPGQLPSQGSQR
jgi:hypothetical protein